MHYSRNQEQEKYTNKASYRQSTGWTEQQVIIGGKGYTLRMGNQAEIRSPLCVAVLKGQKYFGLEMYCAFTFWFDNMFHVVDLLCWSCVSCLIWKEGNRPKIKKMSYQSHLFADAVRNALGFSKGIFKMVDNLTYPIQIQPFNFCNVRIPNFLILLQSSL